MWQQKLIVSNYMSDNISFIPPLGDLPLGTVHAFTGRQMYGPSVSKLPLIIELGLCQDTWVPAVP